MDMGGSSASSGPTCQSEWKLQLNLAIPAASFAPRPFLYQDLFSLSTPASPGHLHLSSLPFPPSPFLGPEPTHSARSVPLQAMCRQSAALLGLQPFGLRLMTSSFHALELVHHRRMFPLSYVAHLLQSRLRRLGHRRLLPYHGNRRGSPPRKRVRSQIGRARGDASGSCGAWDGRVECGQQGGDRDAPSGRVDGWVVGKVSGILGRTLPRAAYCASRGRQAFD